MTAPVIEGQVFPPAKFEEYPKALYADGVVAGVMRVVNDADEEAAARAEGFASLAEIKTEEPVGDETTAASEGDETVAGAEAADLIEPAPSGADA